MLKEICMIEKPCLTFLENFCIAGIFESFDKVVDLLILDSFQVVAAGHVELESVRASKSEFFGDHMKCHPALDIFAHCLWNVKFCRPFAVVCLILCHDTWFRNTCGKFRSIHLLYCL